MYLSELGFRNWRNLWFGPSSFDVWTPSYDNDDDSKAMTIFEGYETVETRILEVFDGWDNLRTVYIHCVYHVGDAKHTRTRCAEFFSR